MLVLVLLNAVMLLIAAGVLRGIIPVKFITGIIEGLHATIGITTPTARQVRWVTAFWIAFILVTVDGMLLLFRYVF